MHAGAGMADRTTWCPRVATSWAFAEWLETTPATAPETARAKTKARTVFFIM